MSRFAIVIASSLLLSSAVLGCSAEEPKTEIAAPTPYPDCTTPEACWETFLWAWRNGDVTDLEQIYGLYMLPELKAQIEKQGAEKVSEWYRKGAEDLVIQDAHWDKQGEGLAYLTAHLGRPGEVPKEVTFSFVRRGEFGWCVTGKLVRR